MVTICSLAKTLAASAILAVGLSISVHAGGFQTLKRAATETSSPGEFVWADLFTTDPIAARIFYCDLFGWTYKTITQNGRDYTVFVNDGRPVAGLELRPFPDKKRPSRWINYIGVTDLTATLSLVSNAGGIVQTETLDFPGRGTQAIITDSDGLTVGLLQSRSGDSHDEEAKAGDWCWFELFAEHPQDVSAFYRIVFKYGTASDPRKNSKHDLILSSGGFARAGVAPIAESEDGKLGWLGVIRVDSIALTIERTIKLGGRVIVSPRDVGYRMRFSLIADPTGGTVGLVEHVNTLTSASSP